MDMFSRMVYLRAIESIEHIGAALTVSTVDSIPRGTMREIARVCHLPMLSALFFPRVSRFLFSFAFLLGIFLLKWILHVRIPVSWFFSEYN
jgi:hypothetical protein